MLFDALPLFLLLSARGIVEMPGLASRLSLRPRKSAVRTITAAALCLLALYALVFRLPRRLRPPHAGWYIERYDHRFAGTTGRLDRTISSLNLGPALVILKFWHRPPPSFPAEGGWGSGFLRNDPDLGTGVIYVKGKEDNDYGRLFSCYPGRSVFVYSGTLDRGMLIPLRQVGSGTERGKPVAPAGRTKNSVQLVSSPAAVFFPYSPEFSAFLESAFRGTSPAEIDGRRLEVMGIHCQANEDWQRAAFFFEAALQVENDPESRRNLLNRLLPCYRKTGQSEAADKIVTFVEKVGFNERRLYDVLPERGF
jgi:hypothetical protein